MIKYNLICKCNCTFDSWFANSQEFGRLMKKKIITCIQCNSNDVKKSIMAPNVTGSKKNDNIDYKFQQNIKKKIIEYQNFVKKNCKYVGDNFAQEARSIYYDKKETKGIYGKVTAEEMDELNDEGIETTSIPWFDKTEN